MINIRKLAAVSMALSGTRFVLAEFAIGIALPLILGLSSIRAGLFGVARAGWELTLGFWLVSVAANYVPLFIYAVLIARGGTVQEEGQPEIAHARRFSLQEGITLVPFLVIVLAILQESSRRKR
jgi:hypothetical protein